MWKFEKRCPRCSGHLLVANLLLYFAAFRVVGGMEILNFVASNTLSDGEVETRIFYKGIAAKETSLGKRSTNRLSFRQLSDGKHLIELIYDENESIVDCEFGHQKERVKSFLSNFKNELNRLVISANITVNSLDNKKLPVTFSWMNYSRLRKRCHKKHIEMKKDMMENRQEEDEYQRSKRDVSDIFRVPGTKWCGKGYSADKYTRLGVFSKTDRCCRKHDLSCPFWIGGFDTKYGLFNWRLNTLMHCNCDERFRACLKMVGTSDANLVGKLFFNVVQTKCFVLKPKKKCLRSSWWGTCEKHKMIKQAVLRNNKPF
ncbi:unnamed protein product [Ceutorhynchus assimilis]|uniref:phospholipase A2 n=1 Tax=Ceutorhynchus assimilis TaxID=467358 RepID=A0A9P0DDL4_9CUCU|nr:unnamed protein product [Ceutorhynchus assimilis]